MIFRNILVALVGLVIFVTLMEGSTTPMMLINDCPQETSLPCVLRNPETQEVCVGQSASANITLRLPQVIMDDLTLTHVKVLVRDREFSRGSLVAGQDHDGDERVERWKIRIIFDNDTMIYEVKNAEIKFRDEFVCHLELEIGGQKFQSDPFQWFGVDDCIPPTKPSATDKDTSLLDLARNEDQLNNTSASINALASELAEQKKMISNLHHLLSKLVRKTDGSIQRDVNCSDQLSEMHEGMENVKTKLDTQNNRLDTSNKMEVAVLVLLFIITAKIFITLRVQTGLQNKFSGLLDHIRCNNLSSSSTSDHFTVTSQSSSSLASRNPEESFHSKETKPLLQEDTKTLVNLIPSDHSTVLSQSSSSLASGNQDESSLNKEAKPLLQEHTETLVNLIPSEHSTVLSQSSSSLACRNQGEPSSNKEAKQLLQGDTESTTDVNPSEHSIVLSQSSSSLASRNQDEPSPNKEVKQLLQEDTDTLLNLNPSDEDCKIPDAIQYTNGRPSTDDEQHCSIEMTNIQ